MSNISPHLRGLCLAALVLMWAPALRGAAAQSQDVCGSGPTESWIASCGAIIDNPRETAARRSRALLARGSAFRQLGDAEHALADYSEATRADPENAAAWLDQGAVLMEKGEINAAIASFDTTIALNPRSGEAYNNRGAALSQTGEFSRAAADLDIAVQLSPGAEAVYGNRGFVRLALGDFAGAAADFGALLARSPDDPYRVLWRQLARMRAGTADGEFAQKGGALATAPWPGPVLALYAGVLPRDRILTMDAEVEPAERGERRCEVAFYVGEYALAQGDHAAAGPLLREAAASCPIGFLERAAAIGELGRLKP
jgi:lipoprotein NlpI